MGRGRTGRHSAPGDRNRTAALARPGGPGNQRRNCAHRPDRHRRAKGRRDRRGLDRRGRRRLGGRADREDSRLPRRRDRWRPGQGRRSAARPLVTTPPSTIARPVSPMRSAPPAPTGSTSISTTRRARSATPSIRASRSGRGSSSAARPRSRPGARGRPARASSAGCWSNGPAPRASSSSTIATGGTLPSRSLRAGFAPDACATRRTSSRGSNPAPTRSPVFIAARTRASG